MKSEKQKKSRGSFFYCLGQAFAGIKRHKGFFIASVVTIAACIFLIGLFVAVAFNLINLVDQAGESVCITVFFDEGLEEEEILEIGAGIETWDEVDYVEYTSAEEAWANFQDTYFADYPELAEGFADDNPLADSASYDIYLIDISDQTEVCERLEALDGIRQVNKSDTTAGALTDIGGIVGVVSIVLIVVLLCVSIFLISNTIVTGITFRKDEIQIMKYVGATDFFVKSPFIFEGIIIGLLGAVIPLIILFYIYRSAVTLFVQQFQTISASFSLIGVNSIFVVLVPLSFIIGAGIGFIGSIIATGKHIKV